MSAQPTYKNSKDEEYARHRRRVHDDDEAMMNLIIDEITRRVNLTLPEDKHIACPPKVRALISAIQSSHGGGRVINEPFMRPHGQLARFLHFTGKKEAKEARVRRLINQLELFQRLTGYMLFHIERGGQPTGEYDEQGNMIYTATAYTDFLLPVADAAVQRAYESGLYFGDKTKGVKPARFDALAAQVDWALGELPEIEREEPKEKEGVTLNLDDYLEQQGERVQSGFEKIFDGAEERHGGAEDCLAWLDRQYSEARRRIQSREKTYKARRDFTVLDDEEETGADPTKVLPLPAESGNESNDLESEISASIAAEKQPDMLKAALEYAAEGYAVFPLHTPDTGGSCSCRKPDCRNVGKHPRTSRGCLDASRDVEQITKWWGMWPDANIGIATGEVSACVVLDMDIKNGGDAGLSALLESIELLPTKEIISGGGRHFYFAYEGSDIRNSAGRVGEGLDVRGEGGYIVAAPSLHYSGVRYRKANDLCPAPLPDALKDLMLNPPVPQSNVSQFRYRTGQGIGGASFPEGERNDGLFRVGCAIWGKGNAEDLADLHAQLLDANLNKCSPPLDDAEVMKMATNIAGRYARGVPINDFAA